MTTTNSNIPEAAQRALDRAIMQHLGDPNVSLIDLGLRIRDNQDRRVEKELCVRVHVRRKLYAEAFEAFAERYPERVIDPANIGYPVDVPQGDYRIHQSSWWNWWSPVTCTNPRCRVANPLRGGISISNAWLNGYGTLGGAVVDRDTGAAMILSNWHVLVGAWYVPSDVAIYQPGQWHGGGSEQTVAYLTRHAIDQNIDAAVAELNGRRPISNDQLGIGPVTGASDPQLGMTVTKSGCASGVTSGFITGVEGRQMEYYAGTPVIIRHIVHIAQVSPGSEVSRKGDSGSWWLEESSHRAVALHFAGSNIPEYGLGIAMPPVLKALNVDIPPATEAVGVEAVRRVELAGVW